MGRAATGGLWGWRALLGLAGSLVLVVAMLLFVAITEGEVELALLVACFLACGLLLTAGLHSGFRAERKRILAAPPLARVEEPRRVRALIALRGVVDGVRGLLGALFFPLLYTAWLAVPLWAACAVGLLFPQSVGRFVGSLTGLHRHQAVSITWCVPVAYAVVSFGFIWLGRLRDRLTEGLDR